MDYEDSSVVTKVVNHRKFHTFYSIENLNAGHEV